MGLFSLVVPLVSRGAPIFFSPVCVIFSFFVNRGKEKKEKRQKGKVLMSKKQKTMVQVSGTGWTRERSEVGGLGM